jgi:hypothetical protein
MSEIAVSKRAVSSQLSAISSQRLVFVLTEERFFAEC